MIKDNKWKLNGIKIISEDALDDNTPQTKGMKRYAAIAKTNVGAKKIWAEAAVIYNNSPADLRVINDIAKEIGISR